MRSYWKGRLVRKDVYTGSSKNKLRMRDEQACLDEQNACTGLEKLFCLGRSLVCLKKKKVEEEEYLYQPCRM